MEFIAHYKTDISPILYNSTFSHIKHIYSSYTHIFTDGSKDNNKVALAVIFPNKSYSQKLPQNTSIYTAELFAVKLALLYIRKRIIFTDSLSALQSLESQKIHHPVVLSILTVIHYLHTNNFDVILCWIPSHVGILGNEKADRAAKSALNLPNITLYPLPYSVIKNTYLPDGNSFGII